MRSFLFIDLKRSCVELKSQMYIKTFLPNSKILLAIIIIIIIFLKKISSAINIIMIIVKF